jgi:hypothetical protein
MKKHHEEASAQEGGTCLVFVATCFSYLVLLQPVSCFSFVATCFLCHFVFVETLTLCSQDEDARLKRCDFVMLFVFGWS